MIASYFIIVLLQGLASLLAILSLWQISLHVETAVFGQYSLYLSIIMAATMFLISWPNAALLRYGREEWKLNRKIGETLASRFVFYLVAVCVSIVGAWLLSPLLIGILKINTNFLFLVVIGIVIFPLAELAVYANQAVGKPVSYGYTPLVKQVIFFGGILLIPVMAIKVEVNYLIKVVLLASSIASIFALLSLPRCAWQSFRPSWMVLKKIFRYSWAIPLGAVAAYTVQWIDLWVIRIFMKTEDVGVYSWAYQLTALGGLVFTPLNVILTPTMIDAHLSGNYEQLSQYAQRLLRLMFLITIIGSLLLPAVYPVLATAVSSNYVLAYHAILVLASAIPFQLLSYLINPLLAPFANLIPKVALINSLMAIINVLGDFALVPLIGIVGAAISTWFVFSLGALLQIHLVKNYLTGIKMPRIFLFSLAGLIMPAGVFCLWSTGPFLGALLCSMLTITIFYIARQKGLFTAKDADWLNAQALNQTIKRVLVPIAKWLAASESKGESPAK
jgi:O-antigen/teichoic acid export membrane protein